MNEPSVSRSERWRQRLQRIRAGVRRMVPFASGVLARARGALAVQRARARAAPLTTREVKDTVAQVMASATPPPAYSERVYQVIRPSLVLIQTRTKDEQWRGRAWLGQRRGHQR